MSGNHTGGVPTATELWNKIDGVHFGLLTAAIVASVLVLILSLIQYSHVIVYTSNENLRSNMYFIISTPLITCGTSLLGMIMPRSAAFLYGSAMCYYMIVLQINISLMHSLFGSRQALQRYMNSSSRRIKLAVKPYWCCCKCLPSYPPTVTAFRICEGLILQSVVVRIVLQIMEICFYYELGHRQHIFFHISHIIGLVSMWIGFYMVYVLIDIGKERLEPYKYSILFRFTDLAQTLASLQKIGIDLLAGYEIIPGNGLFSPSAAGHYYFNCLWCLEMLALSLAASYIFQPSKVLMFDRYPNNEQVANIEASHSFRITSDMEQEQLLDKYEAVKRASKEAERKASEPLLKTANEEMA